jgi:hypothetical protein
MGGTHNLAADRKLDRRMETSDPRIPAACKANRAFSVGQQVGRLAGFAVEITWHQPVVRAAVADCGFRADPDDRRLSRREWPRAGSERLLMSVPEFAAISGAAWCGPMLLG